MLISEKFSNVVKIIQLPNRVSSIDFFRAVAIISVVVYHFNDWLPYGYLGVDLFFVISGFLVSGILITDALNGKKINYFKFVFVRGFKIWPSYYCFIFLGNILAFFFYSGWRDDQIIPLLDIKKYIFFYHNYRGGPYHWSFDHVWSLCVEEHFYLLLPFLFLLLQIKSNQIKS